ncbi:MAG: hypothetical protein V1871_04005 [Planctomycetota bacterium]
MAKSQRSPDYFGANKKWLVAIIVVISLVYIMTFNYGGCGGSGDNSSGSSGSIILSTSATTNPATNVTQTSATLNGTINQNGGTPTAYYFQYGLTTSYGSTTTYQNIISGSTPPINVTANITGLLPNTNYSFRIRAIIGSTTYNGANQNFNTGLPPICTTNSATNITDTSAKLNGTVNPNGDATIVYFNYGLTTSYTATTTSQAIGSGASDVLVYTVINGLSPNTLYNFRVVGTNSSGRIYGDNLTFTTSSPLPICTTQGATNITANSATLNGTVNPNGVNVISCRFDYGTSQSYGINATVISLPGSGVTPISVTANVSSLASSTLYNFRMVATNSNGTTNGANQTFTTGFPPTCATNPATNITINSATLNGTINPNGTATTAYFNYGLTTSYTITTTSQAIGTGTTGLAVSATISSLTLNAEYNFRVVGSSSFGTTYGSNRTFTPIAPPSVCATQGATNVTANSVTLNGTVNPNGVATTAYFGYGPYGTYPLSTTAQAIGSGTNPISVTANVSSLTNSTLYNFRVVGTNSSGTTNGDNRTFTTGAPVGSAPTCTTDPADNITTNSARLNGTVNPNGTATNAYFNYGLTTSYTITTTSQAIGSGVVSLAVSATAGSLTQNTLYNFRVVGKSTAGTTNGLNQTFTTSAPPTCTTNVATNIGSTLATLNGTVNPNGLNVTSCYFDYGLTQPAYGSTATVSLLPGSGTNPVSVTANVSSLASSILYNFRVVATNSGGTTNGNNLSFTTTALPPPTCATNAADNTTTNSARLNGTINPNGTATTAYFNYGLTTSYTITTTSQAIGSGTSDVAISATAGSLTASTQYNFRVVGVNASGTTSGNNLTFTTTALPPPTCTTNVATNIGSTSATLNGTVNPNGLGVTSCYFQYGTTESYGSQQSVATLPGSGISPISVTANVSSLIPSTPYNFRVVGSNSAGTTLGNNLTFTTLAAPPPSAPTGVYATAGNTQVTVSWSSVSGATSYNLYWSLTTGVTKANGAQITNVTSPYAQGGLTNGTPYYYVVTAVNSYGESSDSAQVSATPSVVPPAVDDYCWVANLSSATVTRIQKSTSITTTITVGSGPRGVAVDGTYCWVVNSGSNTVTRIVKSTLATITIAVGTYPYGVAVDETYCWVSNRDSNNVTRITKTTGVVYGSPITVGTSPRGVAVDGTYCWVVNYSSDNVTRILKSTGVVNATIATGDGPQGVAVDETYCWVVNSNANTVTRILKSTGVVYGSPITVGTFPGGVAVDETYCWVANSSANTVTRITKTTGVVYGSPITV